MWYSPAKILAGFSIAALALIGIAILANKSVRGLVGSAQHMATATLPLFALILLVIVFAGVTLTIARGKHHGPETALREEQERYRDLFENAHDLIQLVEPDGLLLDVNRAWMDTLGYAQQDVTAGLYTWDVLEPSSIPHCR